MEEGAGAPKSAMPQLPDSSAALRQVAVAQPVGTLDATFYLNHAAAAEDS